MTGCLPFKVQVMQQNSEPDVISIDLSQLNDADRRIMRQCLLRSQRFAADVARIREINPTVADNLVKSYHSKQAAVFAESELIAAKINKGKIQLLAVSAGSTDAFYIQEKIGGIYVRQEIKSVTQKEASAIDQEIMNAEVQHKDRLNEEQDKPTWHKTMIVIGNDNNPWPCRTLEDLARVKNNRPALLALALHRIQKLQMGSIKPSKIIVRQLESHVVDKLSAAEEAQQKKLGITADPLLTPTKRPLPPPPPAASQGMQLRHGRSAQGQPKPAPLTPNRALVKRREEEYVKIMAESKEMSPKTRRHRKLLVTEQITVGCSHLNLIFVLDRNLDKFTAHFKDDPKPAGAVKRPRQHWDNLGGFRSKYRYSADPDGNSPLHLAINQQRLDLVEFFSKPDFCEIANKKGDFPLHLAVKQGSSAIVKLLVQVATTSLDRLDSKGNTALHLACLEENVDIVKQLLDSGADADKPNKAGQTPRAILKASSNPDLHKLLDSAKRNNL